jgi:Fe-S-cluster-containing hydrogenase component 2
MSRKVRIDEAECIGCGSCADLCPDVFELNHEIEKAFVIKLKAEMRSAFWMQWRVAPCHVYSGINKKEKK